jgi:hypothetical protein
MVIVFEDEGNFYLCMPSWEKHQQVRAKRRKYPEMNGNSRILQTSEITCKQMITDVTVIQSNPVVIQSESNPILENIKSLYNEICTSLPKAQRLNDTRIKTLQARLKEYPDIKIWKQIFDCVAGDAFWSGRDGKWKGCNFDWIIHSKNCTKIYERSLHKEENPTTWP